MKRLVVAAAAALLFTCSTVQADGPAPQAPAAIPFYIVQDAPPAPEGAKPAPPAAAAPAPHAAHAHPHPQPIALFQCVRIEDPHHVAPCAVPLVIQVKDPCWKPCRCRCDCNCAPKCVNVLICVPPCGCPKITVRRGGAYVKYDYGKYRIEIRSRRGVVKVDYDD